MKLLSFITGLLFVSTVSATGCTEPDVSNILCNWVRKLRRMAWIYDMEDPDLPSELGQGRLKNLNAINQGMLGNLVYSMHETRKAIKRNEALFSGSLQEAFSILASGYSRYVARAIYDKVEDQLDPVTKNAVIKRIKNGIKFRDDDRFQDSCWQFTKAVEFMLDSNVFCDRYLPALDEACMI